jgi:tRNA G46 methylase TrmB
VVSEQFLRAAARALAPEGELRIATDHADYFAEIERTVARVPQFAARPNETNDAAPVTTFEARFREDGAQIYRLSLRKISPRK